MTRHSTRSTRRPATVRGQLLISPRPSASPDAPETPNRHRSCAGDGPRPGFATGIAASLAVAAAVVASIVTIGTAAEPTPDARLADSPRPESGLPAADPSLPVGPAAGFSTPAEVPGPDALPTEDRPGPGVAARADAAVPPAPAIPAPSAPVDGRTLVAATQPGPSSSPHTQDRSAPSRREGPVATGPSGGGGGGGGGGSSKESPGRSGSSLDDFLDDIGNDIGDDASDDEGADLVPSDPDVPQGFPFSSSSGNPGSSGTVQSFAD